MSTGLHLINTSTGVRLAVRVISRAKSNAVAGVRDHALLCRVVATPVNGSANRAVTALLADTLGVSKRAVRIVRGTHTRQKEVEVVGVEMSAARERLLAGRAT